MDLVIGHSIRIFVWVLMCYILKPFMNRSEKVLLNIYVGTTRFAPRWAPIY